MNPENIKMAFDICLESGDQRFNAPFYTTLQQSKVAVATDAHMMLIVKNLSYLDGLEIRDRDLDIAHCVPTDWQYPFELVTADLRNEIQKYVYTQVHEIECKECDGVGEVEYTYEALNGETYTKYCTCPICDGNGTLLSQNENDKPQLKSNQFIRILNGNYDACIINKVCYILETLQIEKIAMNAEPKTDFTSFPLFVATNKEITIVAMPCAGIDYSQIKTEYKPQKR